MLADGSCYEQQRSGFYDEQERDIGITSNEVLSLQIQYG